MPRKRFNQHNNGAEQGAFTVPDRQEDYHHQEEQEDAGGPRVQGWMDRQSEHDSPDKRLIAGDFADHEFLVPADACPEEEPRAKVASIFVGNGSTQSEAVGGSLTWMEQRRDLKRETFDITWYSIGAVVPSLLRSFVQRNPDLAAAAQLFLFPGKVDRNLGSVSGPEATEYVRNFKGRRRFTYAFLGAHAFDITTGEAYFHFSDELELQRACAALHAVHKFLFLSPAKFKFQSIEGHVGYGLADLLCDAQSVSICTASSPLDDSIQAAFQELAGKMLEKVGDTASTLSLATSQRRLTLRIAGRDGARPVVLHHNGILKAPAA